MNFWQDLTGALVIRPANRTTVTLNESNLTREEAKNLAMALDAARAVINPTDHPGQYRAVTEGMAIMGRILGRMA